MKSASFLSRWRHRATPQWCRKALLALERRWKWCCATGVSCGWRTVLSLHAWRNSPRRWKGGVMIPVPAGTQIWVSCGTTDMRKGIDGLAMLAQEVVKKSPYCGHLFAFRGKRGDRIKILWWDGSGLCLYANYLASYCISFNWKRGL